MRWIGYIITYPLALVFKIVNFLYQIELGGLFAGVMFLLNIYLGVTSYMDGEFSVLGSVCFYTMIFGLTGGLGAFVINTTLRLVRSLTASCYYANQRWKPEPPAPSEPLDEFIERSKHDVAYGFEQKKGAM